jgi:TonB family protein
MNTKDEQILFSKKSKMNWIICLIAVLSIHLFLLFFQFKNEIKTATYSTIESSLTQLKTVVKLVSYTAPIKKQKKLSIKKAKGSIKKIKDIPLNKSNIPERLDTAKTIKMSKGISSAKAKYEASIRELVNQHRFYPKISRRLKQTGIVNVYVMISRDGKIIMLESRKLTKHKYLNQGALRTIRNIGQFPKFPKELKLDNWEGIIPIKYDLR